MGLIIQTDITSTAGHRSSVASLAAARLRNDLADYLAVDIGQAMVAAAVAESQAFVIEAHLVKNGGV